MQCESTGGGADFGNSHVYASNKFQCPECGREILATNGKPYYDKHYNMQDEYEKIRTE